MKATKTTKTFRFDPNQEVYVIVLEENKSFLARLFGTKTIIQEKPREGCRAFFSGLLISDEYVDSHISVIYEVDGYSEYVGAGEYSDNRKAFPKSVATTFDGIAVDKGTRVVLYSKKKFRGKVLLDITGPAIINNIAWVSDARIKDFINKEFDEPLQSNFPVSCRQWSASDMNKWSKGSVKVICMGNA